LRFLTFAGTRDIVATGADCRDGWTRLTVMTNDLKATLSNKVGFLALTKYTWGPAQTPSGLVANTQSTPGST
jgi:hypothetical protein